MIRLQYLVPILVLVASNAALSATAQAQQPISVDDFIVCKTISDPNDRLRCVDKVFDKVGRSSAVSANNDNGDANGGQTETVIQPRTALQSETALEATPENARDDFSEPKIAAQDSFGFSAERVIKNDRPDALSADIESISRTKSGKYVIILSNGQVWRQIRADTKRLLVKNDGEGAVANIKRRSLGSHTLSLEGSNRSIKVKRVK